MAHQNFSITKKTKGKLPSLPFLNMKNKVLGKKYDLGIIITNSKEMHRLNKLYRKINTPTDILSFALSKNAGEIFLCISEAKKEAKKFDMPHKKFIPYLFIHGMVHLLGFDHGKKMEALEQKFGSMFKI